MLPVRLKGYSNMNVFISALFLFARSGFLKTCYLFSSTFKNTPQKILKPIKSVFENRGRLSKRG